jgi:hypothetical protein
MRVVILRPAFLAFRRPKDLSSRIATPSGQRGGLLVGAGLKPARDAMSIVTPLVHTERSECAMSVFCEGSGVTRVGFSS